MNSAILIACIASLPGVLASYLAYRGSIKAAEKASRSETAKVEAGAYERARKMYEAGIQQLEEQVARLRQQVRDEQTVSNGLRERINELEEIVSHLRSQIIRAGIELAPSDAKETSE